MDFRALLKTEPYDFLRTEEHLGKNIILLGLGGSHAYGTNVEGSDIDVRGCALNTKKEILTGRNFEQVIDEETDTTVYSFNKLVRLLSNANPNTMELLGLRPEHYLYVNPAGQSLLDHAHLFLSKRAAYSFGGYARDQAKRLENKAVMTEGQERKLGKHMMHMVRLYYMCFDILEHGKIITFREKEHALLMALRNGTYLDGNGRPAAEFYEMVEELDQRLNYAKEHTTLPEEPDMEAIYEYAASVNEKVVKGEIV